jgi:hypothetical protein
MRAATSLSLALLVGGKVFAAMKRSLGIGEWIRRALGVAVLGAVAAIAFGLDTGFLTQLSLRVRRHSNKPCSTGFKHRRSRRTVKSSAPPGTVVQRLSCPLRRASFTWWCRLAQ